MATYFGETDIFASIGASYGAEYGPVGEAVGAAAGSALDKTVDAALGYAEKAGRRLLGYGRKNYPTPKLIEAGYEEYKYYILHGYYKPRKFPKLRDGEWTHYNAGREQFRNQFNLEPIKMSPGWAFDLMNKLGITAVRTSFEAFGGQEKIAQLEAQAKETAKHNKMARERNKVRYLVGIGKNPKLGPILSCGWAQQNLVNGVVGGFLPAEMLSNLPKDVAQQARRALAGIESGAAAVGETAAEAYDDTADRAGAAADRAAAAAREKVAETLAKFGR